LRRHFLEGRLSVRKRSREELGTTKNLSTKEVRKKTIRVTHVVGEKELRKRVSSLCFRRVLTGVRKKGAINRDATDHLRDEAKNGAEGRGEKEIAALRKKKGREKHQKSIC